MYIFIVFLTLFQNPKLLLLTSEHFGNHRTKPAWVYGEWYSQNICIAEYCTAIRGFRTVFWRPCEKTVLTCKNCAGTLNPVASTQKVVAIWLF